MNFSLNLTFTLPENDTLPASPERSADHQRR